MYVFVRACVYVNSIDVSVRVSLCIPFFFFLGARLRAWLRYHKWIFPLHVSTHILSLFFSITLFLSLSFALSSSRHSLGFFFFSLPKFFFTRSPFFTSIPLSLCVFFVTFQKNSVVLVSTIILDYINYLLITLYYIFWFSLWCLRRFSFFPPLFFFFFPSLTQFFFFFFLFTWLASLRFYYYLDNVLETIGKFYTRLNA